MMKDSIKKMDTKTKSVMNDYAPSKKNMVKFKNENRFIILFIQNLYCHIKSPFVTNFRCF